MIGPLTGEGDVQKNDVQKNDVQKKPLQFSAINSDFWA